MNFQSIPAEMKALKQWVCYRSYKEKESGRQKKIIISPVTGKFAKCNEPDTWTDYEHARSYCLRNRYEGLCFALTEGIVFIDVDHALDKNTGELLSQDAALLMESLSDTYTERSVSGAGIHILFKGRLPGDALKRNDEKGIEMYDGGRFVCMTGYILNAIPELKDYSDITAALNYEFIGRRPPPRYFRPAVNMQSDTELIQKISESKQGAKFSNLYNGNFSGYQSRSNADFAFVSMLAWWTRDAGQIDRIFRGSGLFRDKWDRSLGASTYGAVTIENALLVQQPKGVRRVVKDYEM